MQSVRADAASRARLGLRHIIARFPAEQTAELAEATMHIISSMGVHEHCEASGAVSGKAALWKALPQSHKQEEAETDCVRCRRSLHAKHLLCRHWRDLEQLHSLGKAWAGACSG